MLRRLALAGMVALLVGGAACAETPDATQDDSIEAVRTRANAGDAEAQHNLGLLYLNGLGVPQDEVEAYKWFNLATTYTDPDVLRVQFANARDEAAERLTPEPRADAQRRAREFFEAHPPEWRPR
jgi:TPR repeat protein